MTTASNTQHSPNPYHQRGKERMTNCGTCSMLLPAERPVFHPHVYCMLYRAGVRDPDAYMTATFPLLADHFAVKDALSKETT